MVHYIQQLKAEAEAAQRREAEQNYLPASEETQAARDRMTPLADRLGRLLKTIPPEVQRAGLSLPALSTMLRGRGGGGCSAGELGAALRGRGYRRVRSWRGGDDGGFSALWYPPGSA